jgi:membrane associated rhomboid family serine protease
LTEIPPSSPPLDPLPAAKEPMFRVPPATGWLIAINVLIQIVRGFLPVDRDDLVVNSLGFNASSLYGDIGALDLLSLVTYQFLHGGWDHLAINMVSLLAFGSGVEQPIGKLRYLILYVFSGVAGALLESAFASPTSGDLLIGASASISGVFGALMVIWGLYRRGNNPMGALRMTLLWIVLMAVTGILGVGAPQGTPVAWIAHIGGFIAGIVFGFAFRPRVARF